MLFGQKKFEFEGSEVVEWIQGKKIGKIVASRLTWYEVQQESGKILTYLTEQCVPIGKNRVILLPVPVIQALESSKQLIQLVEDMSELRRILEAKEALREMCSESLTRRYTELVNLLKEVKGAIDLIKEKMDGIEREQDRIVQETMNLVALQLLDPLGEEYSNGVLALREKFEGLTEQQRVTQNFLNTLQGAKEKAEGECSCIKNLLQVPL